MTFSNKNISTAHVKDEETRNALVRIEKQFKQLYDMIVATQTTVATLPTTTSTDANGAYRLLKTFTADGSATNVTFEDADGLDASTYTTYMILGEGLRSSTDTDGIFARFSQSGTYETTIGHYSYLGRAFDYTSSNSWQAQNDSKFVLTYPTDSLGGASDQAETSDFVMYLTTSPTAGRPTKLRWWITYENETDQGFHGVLRTVMGNSKFSTADVNHTSDTGSFSAIDGIKLWYGTTSSEVALAWGTIKFYGLI